MLNRIWQVCLTYLTAITGWTVAFLVCFLVLEHGFYSDAIGDQEPSSDMSFFPILMPLFMIYFWFFKITKWQFANYRARLIPDFVRVHLLVVGVALFASIYLNPFMIASLSGWSHSGCVAFAFLISAALIWQDIFIGVFGVWVLLILIMRTDSIEWFWFSHHRFLWAHGLIVIGGLASIGCWFWRLANLHEELPDYKVEPIGGQPRDQVEARRRDARLAARGGLWQKISDRWYDRLPLPGGTTHDRFKLLHYGSGRFPFWFVATGVVLAVAGLISFITWGNKSFEGVVLITAWITSLLPIVSSAYLSERLEWMSLELVRPPTRREYVTDLIWIAAKQATVFWVIGVVALTVSVIVSPPIERVNLISLGAAFICLSVAFQIPSFGLGLCLAACRETIPQMAGLAGIAVSQITLLLVWWTGCDNTANWPFVLFMVLLLVPLGAYLVTCARNVWLNVEMT